MSTLTGTITRYLNYNIWANNAIAVFLEGKEDLLDKELISSFPTIRKTLFHIADAQHIWLQRMTGTSLTEWPSKTMNPGEAVTAMQNTAMSLAIHAADKGDSFYNEVITFKAMDGTEYRETNGNIIMHVVNHSTFHRGQLITMFRNAGLEGKMPRTDFIAYLREMEGEK